MTLIPFERVNKTEYVNVLIKIGDGRNPAEPFVSQWLTSDSMGVYIGINKLYRSYYSNRTLSIEMPHNSTRKIGDIVRFATSEPAINTVWEIISKRIVIGEGKVLDQLVLHNKRSEKRYNGS